MSDNKLTPEIEKEAFERIKKLNLPTMQYRGLPDIPYRRPSAGEKKEKVKAYGI